jgi:hypothetical protein
VRHAEPHHHQPRGGHHHDGGGRHAAERLLHRNVVLSFNQNASGNRLGDVV